MIKYIENGNIFNLPDIKNYAHGCNCAGAMGKGIALQFREKFPEMYTEYKKMCKNGLFNPGDIYTFHYGEGYVYNLGTQKDWKSKAEILFIEESLEKMFQQADDNHVTKIALPKIGAGLGGLNWQEVKRVLENIANKYKHIELFVVENYQP